MAEALQCWKCGASIDELPVPLGRLAECSICKTDQHVCRMCEFYDTSVAKACKEPIADEVHNKLRSNFCGYFQARPGAYIPPDQSAANLARIQLDGLFGEPAGETDEVSSGNAELDRLFGLDDNKE